MQKTITLYPRYITADSGFSGILSANGTGEDYRTLDKKDHDKDGDGLYVGVIGFDCLALLNKSTACVLNTFALNYRQKSDPDYGSGAGGQMRHYPQLITAYGISGNQLTVNAAFDTAHGFGQFQYTNDGGKDSWQNRSCTLFSGAKSNVIGNDIMLGDKLYIRQRSPYVVKQKSYMSNLSASVTYTARYYAYFYSDSGDSVSFLSRQTVEGGSAPTVTPEIAAACEKEGYNLIGWEDRMNNPDAGVIWPTPPAREDTDIFLYPVYEKIKFRVTMPYISDKSEFLTQIFDESTNEWIPAKKYAAGKAKYSEVEYGKKVRIYAYNMADESEDITLNINGAESRFPGGEYVLVFETEKLTENVTISSVGVSTVYFDIQTNATSGGTVTPSFKAPRTEEYSVEILPDTGYKISKVTKNGVELPVTNETGMTIDDVASGDTMYAVTFSKIKISVTLNCGENITVSGKTSVDYGSYEKWVISAADGYSIDTITVNGETAESFFKKQDSFTFARVIFAPVTIDITASNNLVTITAQECENGMIRGNIGTYIKGKGVLNIEALPNPSYRFSAWTGVDFATREFTLDTANAEDSYTLGATFTKYDCLIDVTFLKSFEVMETGEREYGGTIEIIGASDVSRPWPNNYTGYCKSGDTVTVKVNLDEGYEVSKITWDESTGRPQSSAESSITLENVLFDRHITVELKPKVYTLTITTESPDGKLTGGTELEQRQHTISREYRAYIDLEAVPDEGYYFVKWSDDVYTPMRDYYFPAHNQTLTAYFRRYEYNIDISAEKHGKIEISTGGETTEGSTTAKHFDNALLLVTPDFGYRVADVFFDRVSIKSELTVTRRNARYLIQNITQNHKIEVLFEEKLYTNGRRLIDYYPPVIQKIKDMQEIVKGQQPLINELWDAASFVTENQFIDTATEEGVEEWEAELGITPAAHDTFEVRKKRLKNRWVPDNRFTCIWLYNWLKRVSGREDIKEPSVEDYVLTIRLPAVVDYLSIFKELERYKPANIGINAQISADDGKLSLTAGIGIVTSAKITLESEAENENQTDE